GCGYSKVNLCEHNCGADYECDGIAPGQGNCDSQCKWHAVCGDGKISDNEACELPNTANNNNCKQSTTECDGKKTSSRDSYGSCGSSCQCVDDAFGASKCVKGSCGATCATNSDCDDGNSYTTDTCDIGSCSCKHAATAYCGDGAVNNNEVCENPSTTNNQYCSQSAYQCVGTKKAVRDSYGNCNSQCACSYDSFGTAQCVQGSCGAECDSDGDCNDGNQHTTDKCSSNCVCEHTQTTYCGDGVLNNGEACERPSTSNNNYCGQSAKQCSGTKTQTRDSYGNCNSGCGCTYDNFGTAQCIQGSCGAACDSNNDCDDGDSHTTDSCDLSSCSCKHTSTAYCGDGIVNNGESCERPSTTNNNYCSQSAEQCVSHKIQTRDSFGNCNSACGCAYDNFNAAQCVKGKCGAECSTNADCNDGNSQTTDTCESNCICVHTSIAFCGDGIVNSNEACELPSTANNNNCRQSTTECSGTKTSSRDSFGSCSSSCNCADDGFSTPTCVQGSCGAECDSDGDCNDGNQHTTDKCNSNCICDHTQIAYCGDGNINNGETCERPSTSNNQYCSQSAYQCVGTKKAVRDSYGNCNSQCACSYDSFGTAQCVKDSCGAECSTNSDCDDGNAYTSDSCDLASCSCKHTSIDYCGDGTVNNNEQCELPGTNNNQYCGQSTEQCAGKKIQTRDYYGNCNSICGCVYDSFDTAVCIQGSCGAECDSDGDCNDGNQHTTDTCDTTTCSCKHACQPYCGDGIKSSSEQCEYPNTDNNQYCSQASEQCVGAKLQTRDSYGNCNSACGCVQDSFSSPKCVAGKCGAECAENKDCPQSSCSECYYDYCEGTQLVDFNKNRIKDKITVTDSVQNTCDNCACTENMAQCIAPTPATYCVAGTCGAECSIDSDCDDNNTHTTDTCNSCMCEHTLLDYCGDGKITFGEECEKPNTEDNAGCRQETEKCDGKKLSTRDGEGSCNTNCGCSYDEFSIAKCVRGKCGAECAKDSDCDDGNALTKDTCNGCVCENTKDKVCMRDGQWGYEHEYYCMPDSTYNHCREDGSGYEHVQKCSNTCGAAVVCEGIQPGATIATCDSYGKKYLLDKCDETCELADSEICGAGSGCTADDECDRVLPGTGDCNSECKAVKQINISAISCFDKVVEDSEQACSIKVSEKSGNVPGALVKLYDKSKSLYGTCTTDSITGACTIIYPAGSPGNHTVYATAEKTGFYADLDDYPYYSYEVLRHRYEIVELKTYNDSMYMNEDYDFYRGENLYAKFQVTDLNNNGRIVPHVITKSTLVSPPGGRAELIKTDESDNWYYYKLTPIPATHEFLGISQLFTFAFNYTDNSGGEKYVNLTIRNNPPKISGTIGPIVTSENVEASLDLAAYKYDIEDSGSDLRWKVLASSAVFEAKFESGTDLLTIKPYAYMSGDDSILLSLYDLDNDKDERTVRVIVTAVDDAPVLEGIPDQSILEDSGHNDNLVDLWQYTTDIDTPKSSLEYKVIYQTDSTIVDCTIDSNRFIDCTTQKDKFGYSDVTLQVTDGTSSDSDTFRVTVEHVNDCPRFITQPVTVLEEEDPYKFITVYKYASKAVDSDGQTIQYLLNQAPEGMTINTAGLVEWQPAEEQLGAHKVAIQATDGECTTEQMFIVEVKLPPKDKYPRRTLQIQTIRMNNKIYEVTNPGDEIYVDLNFANIGMWDVRKGTIRITVEGLGVSRKIGPFSGPAADQILHKGTIIAIPNDAPEGVYTMRVTINTDDGMHRVRHRDLLVVKR
ncbi:MAG: Ig-like domain-containing protein, partial [Candidatus Woesearchaeota archaeon]